MRPLQHFRALVTGVVLLGALTGCSPEERGAVGMTLDPAGRLTVVVWDCDPDAPVGLSLTQVPQGETSQEEDWKDIAVLDAARGGDHLLRVTLADPPAGWTGQRGPAGIDDLDPEAEYQLIVRVAKESLLDTYGYNAGVMSFTAAKLAGLQTSSGQARIVGQGSAVEMEGPLPRLMREQEFEVWGERSCHP